MTLTADEFKGRFQTVTSAEEMADLLLKGFQVLGHDRIEQLIIDIKQDQTGMPFSPCNHDPKTGFFTITQNLDVLMDHYPPNPQKPKKQITPIVDEWHKLKAPEK